MTIDNNSSFIPIIDFSKFLNGDLNDKLKVAHDILNAFKSVGFVYLDNHGIPLDTINHVFCASKRFFDLPLDEKNKLRWTTPDANRGYVSQGREKVTGLQDKDDINDLRQTSPDIKESFEIGNDDSTEYTNNWPDDSLVTGFKDTMLSFYEACYQLKRQLLDAIGIALGLPHGFFDPFINQKANNLRLLHYPPTEASVLNRKDQTRAGAHTDYGSVTLLFQDQQGGLQVKNPEGVFVNAKPIPGTIVVNAGDLLARWSNDIIKSTEHRVISPSSCNASSTDSGSDIYPARYSIAYFGNPNPDATIEALPGCYDDSNPIKYPSINAHEYITSRLSATY